MKHPINTKVKVIKAIDETCAVEFIGKEGIIFSHNGNGMTGNTPDDPLHGVQFNDGRKEHFWFDELEPIAQDERKPATKYLPAKQRLIKLKHKAAMWLLGIDENEETR